MPYTWTGASALGYDLARSSTGAAVSTVLLSALAADLRYARHLAMRPAAPPRVRARAVALVEAAQAVAIVDLRDHAGPAGPPVDLAGELATVSRRVRALRFGGPGDLLDLLHRDGLGHLAADLDGAVRGRATRRLADAVLAAVLAPGRSDVDVAALAHAVRATVPPPPDLGPYGGDVRDLLDGVRAGGGDRDPYRLRSAMTRPAVGQWSRAMHVASWAVELSGRTRPAAAAHMMGVAALARAGFTADDCAAGVWNSLSGRIVARLVPDLLPDTEHRVLTGEG
ncbi:MAG: hypothetical protein ACFCUP_00915 [Actinomycetales bacterium]